MKQVLILERCSSGLERVNESAGANRNKYVLDGTFTEFNRVNRNKRVYSADTFLPHLNEMMGRRDEFGVVYGEFDHPETFDIQLKHTSHIITSANYIANENRVHGEIRLLTTHWGKEARALVDDECPIFVSSRAAGVVESNGNTRLNRLFTYDIVADPGFSSARMSSKNVNESYGMTDDPNIQLYDMSIESDGNAIFERNANDMVTRSQMREYQEYLLGQIDQLKRQLNEAIANNIDTKKVMEISALYENTQTQVLKMGEYLEYLREKTYVGGADVAIVEKVAALEETNTVLQATNEHNATYIQYMATKMDNLISYVEQIAENVQFGREFTEYVAAHVQNGHQYAQHIAKGLNVNADRVDALTEKLGYSIEYTEDVSKKMQTVVQFQEYVAEHLKGSIEYVEFVKEHTEDNMRYIDYMVNTMDGIIDHSATVTERVNLLTEAAKSNTGGMITEAVVSIESPVTALGLNADSAGDEDEDDDDATEDAQVTSADTDAAQPEAQVTGVEGDQNEPSAQDDVNTVPTNDAPAQGDGAQEADAVSDDVAAQDGDVQPVATGDDSEGAAQNVEDADAAQPEPTTDVNAEPIAPEATDDAAAQPVADASQTVIEVGDDSVSIKRDGRETIIKLPAGSAVAQPAAQPVAQDDAQPAQGDAQPAQDTDEAPVQESITEKLNKVIEAAKKQKAAEKNVPAFYGLLSEAQLSDYKALTAEDQEKVVNAMNESAYYTTDEVIARIQKALSPPELSLNEKLVNAIPADILPQWTALDESQKAATLNTARFYANTLNNEQGIENFWRTRPLEVNQAKVVVLTESVHDDSLSEDAIAFFAKRFQSLK